MKGKFQFLNSEVVKSISLLTTGTILAQLIPLIAAPFIARLFDATEFGEFAAIMAIVKIVTVVINGRYELAIVLPKSQRDARSLLRGAWYVGVLVLVFLLLITLFFNRQISALLEISLTWKHILIVFISLLGVLVWQPANYYFIRNKSYMKMTYSKFVKSITLVTVTLFCGYFSDLIGFNGLLVGFVVCWILLGLFSLYQVKPKTVFNSAISLNRIKRNLKFYSDYPKFNALPALLNSFSSQLGIYVFIFLFSTEVSGHYSFAKQYLYGPMNILGVSLSQVYLQRVSAKFKKSISIKKELSLLFLFLVGVGVVISITVILFSVPIFEFVFGSEWGTAAQISKLLIISFSFQFIVSPLSTVLIALNQVKLASVFPVVYIFSVVALFFYPRMDLEGFMYVYILAEIIPYLVYLLIIVWAVSRYEKRIINK